MLAVKDLNSLDCEVEDEAVTSSWRPSVSVTAHVYVEGLPEGTVAVNDKYMCMNESAATLQTATDTLAVLAQDPDAK